MKCNIYHGEIESVHVVVRKEMLKAASSSSPTPDADKPAPEQMTSESEEPFSEDQQQTEDVDNELSYEEESVICAFYDDVFRTKFC